MTKLAERSGCKVCLSAHILEAVAVEKHEKRVLAPLHEAAALLDAPLHVIDLFGHFDITILRCPDIGTVIDPSRFGLDVTLVCPVESAAPSVVIVAGIPGNHVQLCAKFPLRVRRPIHVDVSEHFPHEFLYFVLDIVFPHIPAAAVLDNLGLTDSTGLQVGGF
jgi:hypothetical protein